MKSIKAKLLVLTTALMFSTALSQAQSLTMDHSKICENVVYEGKPKTHKRVHQKYIRVPLEFPNGIQCVEIDFFARFQRYHTDKPGHYKVRLIKNGETIKVWDSPPSTASLFCDGKTRIKVNNSDYDQVYLEIFDEYNVLPMEKVYHKDIPYVDIKIKTAE